MGSQRALRHHDITGFTGTPTANDRRAGGRVMARARDILPFDETREGVTFCRRVREP